MNILIIDAGTSSMRGILYRDDMKKLLSCQIKYCPICNEKGELRQTAEEFETTLLAIVRTINTEAAELKECIDVISLTAQRSSVLPLDAGGKPLMDVIMWQDTGSRGICRELENYNNKIAGLSGACVNTVFSGGKMAWVRRERPEIYDKVYKLVNIPEYLIHIMTGVYVTDYTYGSRTNLMNLKKCEWDPELLAIFGVKEEHLCELLPPGSICGSVTEDFAAKTGIRKGIPVITAGGDQQCAAVGQGIFKRGKMSIIMGTGAFLTAASDGIPSDLPAGIICNSSAVKGKYIIEANVPACCSAFNWFCNNFYEGKEPDYVKINKELEELYGKEENCIVLPYFQGRSTPEWNAAASASIHKITLSTTRSNILKAILEGIFLEIKNNVDLLGSYAGMESIYISGGLTKSRIMNQMQADIYGLPLYHRDEPEATALGALMVTLHSLGRYDSYDEIFEKINRTSIVEVYEPKEAREYYLNKQQQLNALYKKIYVCDMPELTDR